MTHPVFTHKRTSKNVKSEIKGCQRLLCIDAAKKKHSDRVREEKKK